MKHKPATPLPQSNVSIVIGRRLEAYQPLVSALNEMSIAFGDTRDWPEDWALSWHDRLVAVETHPTTENIRREVHERARALLRELGEL